MNWLEKSSLDIKEILQVLPHRFPFLLVDRVLEIRPGKPVAMGMSEHDAIEARKGTISRTIKNVTMNESHFQGHFPENPIFPGVLTLEALAQSATFAALPFVALSHGGKLPPLKVALAGFDEVRFRKPITPGDKMEMTVTVLQTRGPIWSFQGLVEVDGKKVAEAKLLAQLLFGES